MEHKAAGGIDDTSAIFGRSRGISFNLVGQPTDALLHVLGVRENERQKVTSKECLCHSVCVWVKSLFTVSPISPQ